MRARDMGRWALVAALAAGGLTGCGRQPSTPDERRVKAEELLKEMSRSLAAASSLTVDTTEVSNRVRRGGVTAEQKTTRHIAVRRPDRAYFKQVGSDRENELWYDGRRVTMAMHKDKAWARGPMPSTLDEALDAMATEYGIFLVSADLFYSNPYDSFTESDSSGGWVGREVIDGQTCNHLRYEAELVDWELWLADTPQALPCRMAITYKKETGTPTSMLTFKNWNLSAALADDTFVANVDSGYERLYLVRAATAEPVKSPDQPASPAPAPPTKP